MTLNPNIYLILFLFFFKTTGTLAAPKNYTQPLLKLKMIYIPGGCFQMGCTTGDNKCHKVEKPIHKACVDGFYISRNEVTADQYQKCIADSGCPKAHYHAKGYCNIAHSNRMKHPMNCVKWFGAKAFTKWLSKKTGKKYRLPFEAEWEFAAKSRGENIKFPWGNTKASCRYAIMKDQYWSCGVKKSTWKVCSKPAGNTAQGLCDMAGNVYEWCEDWFGKKYYQNSPKNNPRGPLKGKKRILRGGSYYHNWWLMRTSLRAWTEPTFWDYNIGFRIVREEK